MESASIPVRLKFGMLGKLEIQLKSYTNFQDNGAKIKISKVFLCVEMLDVSKWKDELVISRYQEQKKSSIKTLQNNNDIVFAQFQTEEGVQASDSINKIIANTSIDIDEVYIMYEDESFQFQIGLLLPNIKVKSMDKLFQTIIEESIEDASVLYKQLSVKDVSFFINTGKFFQPIQNILNKANFKPNATELEKWKETGKVLQSHMMEMFADSENRFGQNSNKTKNNYVFLQQFEIQLNLQVVLNIIQARQLNKDFNEPNLKLSLTLGSQNLLNGFLSIELEEEQLKALLHIGTFFGAFSNYSSGCLRERFHSISSKKFSNEDRQKYQEKFINYLKEKSDPLSNEKKQKVFEDDLWKFEKDYRIDILLLIRQAITDEFFQILKLKDEYDKQIQFIELSIKKNMFGVKGDDKLAAQKKSVLNEKLKEDITKVNLKRLQTLKQVDQKIDAQFDEIIDERDFEGEETIEEVNNDDISTWQSIKLIMPKVTLQILTNKSICCFLQLQDIQVKLDNYSMPDSSKIQFTLGSLTVQDHTVAAKVKAKNPGIKELKLSNKIIDTFDKRNLNCNLLEISIESKEIKDEQVSIVNLEQEVYRQKKEMLTTINVNVLKKLIIYLNIFFINNMLQLSTRIVIDMNQKRDQLISFAKQDNIKRYIQEGFEVLNKISQLAQQAQAQLQKSKLQQRERSDLKIYLTMVSPKLIIDEFLLAEEVQDPKKPCYFLVDMGDWKLSNSIVKQKVEIDPSPETYMKIDLNLKPTEKKQALYESWDMSIENIKILYNYNSYEQLLMDEQDLNFKVLDRFHFGLQFQSLIDSTINAQYPALQINLKFKKLRLNLERSIFRQLYKIKTFLDVGSYKQYITELTDAMSNSGDASDDSLDLDMRPYKRPPQDEILKRRKAVYLDEFKFQKLETTKQSVPESSIRINLLFQGIEIKEMDVTWIREKNLVRYKTTDILSFEATDLKISMHLTNIDSKLSLLVLMNELRIKDLVNPNYYFKNLIKVDPSINTMKKQEQQEKFRQNYSKQLSLNFFNKNRNNNSSRQTIGVDGLMSIFTQKLNREASKVSQIITKKSRVNFEEFKNFNPRDEFFKNSNQVQVYLFSSLQEEGTSVQAEQDREIKNQIANTNIVIKLQYVQLIIHFKLIAATMKMVNDLLFDLQDVEIKYKEHVTKNKPKKLADNPEQYKYKFVLQNSVLKFMMPRIKIIIPTNLEVQDTLKLKLRANLDVNITSQEQHNIKYILVENVETEIKDGNILLDRKSDLSIKVDELKIYLSQPKEYQDKKNKEDYILSPLDLTFEIKEDTYANHSNALKETLQGNALKETLQVAHKKYLNIIKLEENRQKIKDTFEKNKMIDRITLYTQEIKTLKPFNLSFRIKQMKMYVEIVQLILYNQKYITDVESNKPFVEEYKESEPAFEVQKSQLERFKHLGSNVININQVVGKIQSAFEKDLDVDLDLENLKDRQSIDELISKNKLKEKDIFEKVGRLTLEKLKKNYGIQFNKLIVETCGMNICLLDDVTSLYDEPLLQIKFPDLDLTQSQLMSSDSSNLSIGEAEINFKQMNKVMTQSGLISNDSVLSHTDMKLEIESTYYNHKSHGEEMLIENYRAKIVLEQISPMEAIVTTVKSEDIFNLNLTYGCILSIAKVLTYFKDDKSSLITQNSLIELPKKRQINIRDIKSALYTIQQENEESSDMRSEQEIGSDSEEIDREQTGTNIELELKTLRIPKFIFKNLTGRKVTFSINNDGKNQIEKEFILEEQELSEENKKLLTSHINDLLESCKTNEDIKQAQLYMTYQIDGYINKKHLSLKQLGIFGHKLQNQQGNQKHYCINRIVSNKDETIIYIESNVLFQNNSSQPVQLSAFALILAPQRRFQFLKKFDVDKNEVFILPLEWIENNYHIQVDSLQDKDPSFNPSNSIIRNGSLKVVLNPDITMPYNHNSAQIKLGDYWIALELALLATRSKFPQFLIMIHSLTKINNLMWFPVSIVVETNSYDIDINKSRSIEELNLSSRADQSFQLFLTADDKETYSNNVNWGAIRDIKGLHKLTTGKLIQLLPKKDQKQTWLTIAMEKVTSQNILFESEYNDFTLRQIIFHHSAREIFEIFIPFVAVNETNHTINLCNMQGKIVNILKPKENMKLNFKDLNKPQIKVQCQGFSFSNQIDLTNIGLHNTVFLNQESKDFDYSKDSIQPEKILIGSIPNQLQEKKALEIGTSIKICENPFYKTKVIRFTQSFIFVNKLNIPIAVQCVKMKRQIIIDKKDQQHIDFAINNSNKELMIRQLTQKELAQYNKSKLKYSEFCVNQETWSKKFQSKTMDDFQIYLPWVQESNDKVNKQWDFDTGLNTRVLRVTITSHPEFNEKIYCVLTRPEYPDYLVFNYLEYPIILNDKIDQDNFVNEINSVQICKAQNPNNPSAQCVVLSQYNTNKKLEIQINEGYKFHFEINKSIQNKLRSISANQNEDIWIKCTSRVQGASRIIEIRRGKQNDQDQFEKKQTREQLQQALFAQVRQMSSEDDEKVELIYQKYKIDLAGIGFSLVDFKPRELCYISIDQIQMTSMNLLAKRGAWQKSFTDLNVSFANFQIDAMQNEVFPVLLGPVINFRNIERVFQKRLLEKDQSILSEEMIQQAEKILNIEVQQSYINEGDQNTDTFDKLLFSLQPIEFKLHISLVIEISELLNSLTALLSQVDGIYQSPFFKSLNDINRISSGQLTLEQNSNKKQQNNIIAKIISKRDEELQNQQPKMILVSISEKSPEINVKKVTKTFFKESKINNIQLFMTLRIRGIEAILQKTGPMSWFLNLSSNFADITDAEFNFTELEMAQGLQAQDEVQKNLVSHYQNQAIQQFYQLLGSQDIIGNPSSFIANVSKGTQSFYNEPLEGLVDGNYKAAATGIFNSLTKIVQSTGIAVTNSYTGFSGSVYLGLKNACGARLQHNDLDRPLTIKGGISKGTIGLFRESLTGVTGIWMVPINRVKKEGLGAPQVIKGIGQGLLQFVLCPVNATLRATYDFSTGTKQQLKGVKDHGQRYRYPRYFDQNDRMDKYDQQFGHAKTTLRNAKSGEYEREVIEKVYDVSKYTGKKRLQGIFKDRVIIITNKSLMYCYDCRKITERVILNQIKGMMFYFGDEKCDSIIVEQTDGKIVRMRTDLPEINTKILSDLKQHLEKLNEKQNKKKQPVQPQLTLGSRKKTYTETPLVGQVNFESQRDVLEPNEEFYLTWETIPSPR